MYDRYNEDGVYRIERERWVVFRPVISVGWEVRAVHWVGMGPMGVRM